jgi:GT2 family glycosyltransferase
MGSRFWFESRGKTMIPPLIHAVMVLYKRAPEESETFTSLQAILQKRSDLAAAMSLLVYDNSPVAQEMPALPVPTRYMSDTANGGLVPAYNAGLQQANEEGAVWLLLLDQDTSLTEDYLAELIATLPKVETVVSAVLPKLVHSGEKDKVVSPHFIPRLTHRGVDAGFMGTVTEELSAFNSAAALRVSAVETIGGFPAGHSIEFLDHTVFHLLHLSGGKIWVMDSALSHKLSTTALGSDLSLDRYKNVLYAERDFYMSWGSGADRLWYRLRRLKHSAQNLLKVKNKQFAMWDLRAAVGALGRRS